MKNGNVFLIAEIGWNWQGDLHEAKRLIKAFSLYADMVKFQLYDIDSIKTTKDDNYWGMKRCQLTKDQMHILADYAHSIGEEIGFSAFDYDRLDWMDDIVVKRHKIASRSTDNNKYVEAVHRKNLPVIASCHRDKFHGLKLNPERHKFMFCVSRRHILTDGITLPDKFGATFQYDGFSDHTIGTDYAIEAIRRGATIIEKHVTFDKNEPGWDNPGSALPQEFKEIYKFAKKVKR